MEIEFDLTAVDSMSCSLRELRARVPALENASFDGLKTWADALCGKITSLLEHIGAIETDAETATVLVRSTPPARQAGATTFYELVLRAPGSLSLRRYRTTSDNPRQPLDLQVTHEVLEKLVADLAATVPA
jgi:hypothetical protein